MVKIDYNNTMKAPDLSQILKPYENKWVAFSPDYKNVVSSGETLKETSLKLSEKDRENAIFYKVLPPSYAPTFL